MEETSELDKNSPHYSHNLFMREADIWTNQHEWTMSIERFKKVFAQFKAETSPANKHVVSDEEIEALAKKEYPKTDNETDWEHIGKVVKIDAFIKGFKAAFGFVSLFDGKKCAPSRLH